MRLLTASALLLPFLAPGMPGQESRPATATVEVRVAWKGDRPRTRTLHIPEGYVRTFPADGNYCKKCVKEGKLKSEVLEIAKAGGVKNVAVSFPRLEAREPGIKPATLGNENCRFEPHVQFVPVGFPVKITNTDPIAHNAHLFRNHTQPFANLLIPPRRHTESPVIRRPGIYKVACDIHAWMGAWLIAARNPWCAVTGTAGKATIKGVPPGKDLQLVLWHERLGTHQRKVTLEPGGRLHLVLTQKDFKRRRPR